MLISISTCLYFLSCVKEAGLIEIPKSKTAANQIRTVSLATLLAALILTIPAGLVAQADSEVPLHTVTVIAGERYGSPPGGQRWLLGDDYRDLWTTPIKVEVLDLQTFAGGLEPVMRVGGMQTLGLALKGRDGRDYSFRSVDKNISDKVIPQVFHGTFLEDIVQDQIAAHFPGVQVVAAPIERAAGVLGLPDPRLVVLPDDPALGEFREKFAGVLGIIVEYPQAVSETNPGFLGASEIVAHEKFWEERQAGTRYLPDTRAFLRARILDLLFNDWDRHRKQWRWARIPDLQLLQPIPEDRDQVFTSFEGVLLGLARFQGGWFVKFEDEFEPFSRIMRNGWDLDRFLLTDIDKTEWMQIASDLQSRLTDDVLDEGLQRLPAEYYKMRGEDISTKLKGRRDKISEMAERFYEYLSKRVDIQCTNQDERVTVEILEDDRMEVTVATLAADQNPGAPYYRRCFDRGETEEIRIYLHGGNDMVVTLGEKGPGITVRVIGGPGSNSVDDSKGFGVKFYGAEGESSVVGDNGTALDRKEFTMPARNRPGNTQTLGEVPWVPVRDWGATMKPLVVAGYQSDPGLIVGGGFDRTTYGFRKYPWSTRHTLKGAFAFGVKRPFLDYKGRFRHENSRHGYVIESRLSGLEQIRYNGLGNETAGDLDNDASKISQYQFILFPGIVFYKTDASRWAAGPIVKYTNSTGTRSTSVLAAEQPLGWQRFGQLGVQVNGSYDSRSQRSVLDPGILIEGEGAYFPEAWDVKAPFGYFDAHVGGWTRPVDRLLLSFHLRGRKTWGDFPYFEAAYIGGQRYPLGTKWDRWAGDASLGGLASARWTLGGMRGIIPGDYGIFGMGDAARVFLKGEDSSKWHPSYGGGIFITGYDRSGAIHLGVGNSAEDGLFFMFIANFAGLAFQ